MDIRSSFIRQRRSLIIISLLLLFAEISGITIRKINVLGNEVQIDNPSLVYVALWIAWIYWFIRYYQYFRDLDDKGFKTAFSKKMNAVAIKKAIKRLLNNPQFNEQYPEKDGSRIYIDPERIVVDDTISYYKVYIEIVYGKPIGSGTLINKDIELSSYDLIIPKIRAGINLPLNTILFSEYILPFIIFLLPLGYKIYQLSLK